MIRTAWVLAVTGFATVVQGGPVIARSVLGRKGPQDGCLDRARAWAGSILGAAAVDVEMRGVDRLSERGQILVANHESWFDVLALAAHLPVDYRFVAKKELETVPVFGPAWKACGHVSVDREDRASAIESLDAAGRLIRERQVTVIMFPEGTRSRTGELQRFKKGAFVLAIQAGVPVVPAGISGSRDVWAKGSWRLRPGTVQVRIGEPIDVGGMTHADRDGLTEEARRRVAALRDAGRKDLEGRV